MHVSTFNSFFELLHRSFRAKTNFNGMLSLAKLVYQTYLIATVFRSWARRRRIIGHLLHLLSKAQGPHVRPDLFNVCEAFRFCPGLARIIPAQSIFSIGWPN